MKIYWEITELIEDGMKAASDISTETRARWRQAVGKWEPISRNPDFLPEFGASGSDFRAVDNSPEQNMNKILKTYKNRNASHLSDHKAKIAACTESLKKTAVDVQ
ncbi:hypothetical protein TRVL_08404 [Trypanosoma vivax]|nr:hypothetical protein TRVL_08404 [Trypanosoma vivax]